MPDQPGVYGGRTYRRESPGCSLSASVHGRTGTAARRCSKLLQSFPAKQKAVWPRPSRRLQSTARCGKRRAQWPPAEAWRWEVISARRTAVGVFGERHARCAATAQVAAGSLLCVFFRSHPCRAEPALVDPTVRTPFVFAWRGAKPGIWLGSSATPSAMTPHSAVALASVCALNCALAGTTPLPAARSQATARVHSQPLARRCRLPAGRRRRHAPSTQPSRPAAQVRVPQPQRARHGHL